MRTIKVPKTAYDLAQDRDRGAAAIRGHGRHDLLVEWDFNKDATADRICRIKIADKEAYVSVDELQKKALRWV